MVFCRVPPVGRDERTRPSARMVTSLWPEGRILLSAVFRNKKLLKHTKALHLAQNLYNLNEKQFVISVQPLRNPYATSRKPTRCQHKDFADMARRILLPAQGFHRFGTQNLAASTRISQILRAGLRRVA